MPLIYSSNPCFIDPEESNHSTTIVSHPYQAINLSIDLNARQRTIPYSLVQWDNPLSMSFSSIGEAKRILNDHQKLWTYYPFQENGRGKLIEEQLIPIKANLRNYLAPLPQAPIGAWTLLNRNKLLFSSATNSVIPFNLFHFNENKEDPPSRAYLKLWEFFTRTRLLPAKGLQAIDLGASPGGWTWVLSSHFEKVIAIDRSPLRPDLMSLKNVEFKKQDVMQFRENLDVEKNAWIFSDVALAPEKIANLLLEFKQTRPDINFVCTLKFTKKSDLKLLSSLASEPNSNLIHLSHNKHEVTWYSINRKNIALV